MSVLSGSSVANLCAATRFRANGMEADADNVLAELPPEDISGAIDITAGQLQRLRTLRATRDAAAEVRR